MTTYSPNQQIFEEKSLKNLVTRLIAAPNNVTLYQELAELLHQNNLPEDATLCRRCLLPNWLDDELLLNGTSRRYTISPLSRCSGIEQHHTNKPEFQPLEPPIQLGLSGNYPQFKWKTTECPGSWTTVVPNGNIWFDGFNTLVINKQGQILDEHVKGNPGLAAAAHDESENIHLSGTVCMLDAKSSFNFYHWLIDVLPKLGVIKNSGLQLEQIDWFVVNASKSFQLESLEHFGIPSSKIVQQQSIQSVQADELWVPFLKNELGAKVNYGLGLGIGSWVPEFLREEFLGISDNPNPDSIYTRIFVSRRNSISRNIQNQQEIDALLEKYKFKQIILDGRPIKEQADILNQAEIVIGAHGAGLTNLVFCSPGTIVMEIFSDYRVPCFWSIANLNKLHYHQFMTTPGNGDTNSSEKTLRSNDIFLNPVAFESALHHIVSL